MQAGKKFHWIGVLLLAAFLSDVAAQRAVHYTNPVKPGDYPDPSLIRVNQDYWATATSSEWGPQFPIMHSRDLVNWELVGSIFSKRPTWATGNFWAPEISTYRGRYYVYYVGHKKDGPLCVAVAIARSPAGPYTDHGPLVCEQPGSIDAMAITDEKGERYLIWKRDGNSINQATPIHAQKLSDDGTRVIGAVTELIRNDVTWENQLVEGPFILRRGDWFYLFYSGNACCGRECNYALGVARSRKLLGPWEKNPANPILRGNETWKCPGHGSIVVDQQGRDFLMYHAYSTDNFVYVGRQALLDEVHWEKDGWPTINNGKGPSKQAASPFAAVTLATEYSFFDDFNSRSLIPGWQWPQDNQPRIRVDHGQLLLSPTAAGKNKMAEAVLARSTTLGDYTAITRIQAVDGAVGLSAFGDSENALGIAVRGDEAILWQIQKNNYRELARVNAGPRNQDPRQELMFLRMEAKDGHRFRFSISADQRQWTSVGEELDGAYLPPWDRGVRVALTVGGGTGRFDWLKIDSSFKGPGRNKGD